MKFLTIALVCLVVGASAVEQSGFFDKLKDFGKKAIDVGKQVVSHPIVKDTVLPIAKQQGTALLNQQLSKKNIPMQFAEEAGFFDKLKDFGKKVVNVGQQVVSHPIMKDTVLPIAKQQGTALLNQQLSKKNIPMQFAEEAGFFDKVKDFGKKVVNVGKQVVSHPIMKDTVLPLAQQHGTALLNQQLSKKNIPMQFAEEAGFFDKVKDFGKKVVNVGKQVVSHPIMKDTVLPLAQQHGTALLNQQLSKKNIPMQFAEEAGFFDFIKKVAPHIQKGIEIGKQVAPVAMPLIKGVVSKGGKFAEVEQSGFFDKVKDFGKKIAPIVKKGVEIGKQVAPVVIPHVKDIVSKTQGVNFKDKNAVLGHLVETGKTAFKAGQQVAPIVQKHF